MTDDPIRARRAQIARWTSIAERLGYLALAIALAAFLVALATGFAGAIVSVITICLIGGSILLAPAIIIRYAVKAAEREDRERGV